MRIVLAALLAVTTASAAWQSTGGPEGSARITILDQSTRGTTFEVVVPGVEVTPMTAEGNEFSLVTLPGEVMAVLEEGKPQVPKVSVLLAIPSGARVTTRVLSRETKTLKVANVYPLQPPLLDGQEPGPPVFDRAFYGQSVSYPGRDVSVVETGVWRDLAVANLQVYPVQVNPGGGEIEVTKRIRVRVDYSGGTYPATVADWMFPQYAKYVDNFSRLGVLPQDEYSPGVRYLVVCHQNHSTNPWLTDSLLGYVKARGYDTRMIVKSSFTAQEIKDSIRAEYNRNTPKTLHYVLLVGEYAEIPMGSYSGVGRSDFWYTDLEPWPSGDNYPEVALGRFSPDSAGDLANQIRKTLKYQKNPPSTSNWLTKIRMPAHSEQYPGKYSGCVRGIYQMPKPYYPTVDIDTIMGQFTGNATVTAAINSGVGIVAYRGHGDYMEWWEWGTEGSWYNSHIDALTNGDLTPVVYNIACNCGDIYQPECLSERWMGKYPGGAVANFGATQASYTYPNHGICSTLVRATTDTWTITVPGVRNYGPTPYNLSDIKAYGVDAYVAKYWPGSPYPYNIWMYVVLGDPALPVWTGGMPEFPTVTAPDSIPTGPYNLNVTVTVGGRPVEGALVCAWKGAEFYVAERTNSSGAATLAVSAATPGQVKLTVSEGHAQHSSPGVAHTPILPAQRTIMAGGGGQPQPEVVYVSNVIRDSPPGGNGNGRFEPGESGTFIVTLRNTGNGEAQNVTAKLKSNHALFVITDSTSNYGNIPAGGTVNNNADRFGATAQANFPPGTYVTCTLKVHSDNWQHDWTYTFTFQVGTPPSPPGTIIWGPRVCSNMPTDWGLYGMAYNPNDNLLYAMYFMSPTIYKYSSDSLLTAQGTVTLPEDSCTDLDYCAYDNTFWILANPRKVVYKITPTGSVVRQFTVPQADYPCGIVEHDAEHKIYVSDRRLAGQTQQRVFVYDTLGTILDTFIHPLSGNYGSRCLALDDRCPVNPPSLLNIFTWFDAGGTAIESIGMLEVNRGDFTLRNRYRFSNSSWNIRGIEYDPRDGSYWISIMQDNTGGNNRIFKVVGFNYGTGVEERPMTNLLAEGEVSARPNPFTGTTLITAAPRAVGTVELRIFDGSGRLVHLAGQTADKGRVAFNWNGRSGSGASLSPGIYFYRLEGAGLKAFGKLILSR